MITLKSRVVRLLIGIGFFSVLSFGQTALTKTGNLVFHETASDVMMNALQTQPEQSFLRKLYTQTFFVPIWIEKDGPSSMSRELFERIKTDNTLNKTGKLYQDTLALEEKMNELYASGAGISQKVNLEFKLSQLYKGYADYTLYGSINWGAFQARLSNLRVHAITAGWITHKPTVSPLQLIENATSRGSLETAFNQAEPNKYRYKALKKELNKYVAIKENGGWLPVPLKSTLKPEESHASVPSIRERLRATGDYKTCEEGTEGLLYDACLKKAVIHFQNRNGLVAKGKIEKTTRVALNKTVEEHIATMKINLDRIKWLNERNSKRHVIINIPAFRLYFEEDDKLRQTMKVIVGKRKNPTPVFSNSVKTIVLNPYWNVPKSIIQKEMIPKLMRNPDAMARKGIEIRSGWGKDSQEINVSSVDWSQYRNSKSMPFRFAQVPGTRNALGKVKFLFPNQFAVYMHDTPTKKLFNRNVRAFSHGCIRLQKPRELLKTFSTFNDTVNFDKSQRILKGKRRTYLSLDSTVPVDVVYLTAWVDYNGTLQFRNDVYGYDKMQISSSRKW